MTAHRRRWLAWFGSHRLRGRAERARARQDMRRGLEPQPRYTTGKHWED